MKIKKRKEIRLKEYDYSAACAYFVTVCTKNKEHLLGKICVGDVLPDIPLALCRGRERSERPCADAGADDSPASQDVLPDIPYVELTEYGQIVKQQFEIMNSLYDDIKVNHYIIMPNHIHFIVEITNGRGTSRRPSPTRVNSAIPKYISTFKRFTNKNSKVSLWQRSYYDHIIRNETDYLEKLNYIKTNPHRWSDDEYFIQ